MLHRKSGPHLSGRLDHDGATGRKLGLTSISHWEAAMSLAMTPKEREAFLADVHVGVIAVAEEGRGPLTVPVWYSYEPGGEIRLVTGRTSRKGRLLERARRFSLCAQTETPPYKYVSVEGPIIAIEAANLERDLRPLARRYLGGPMGDQYVESTQSEHGDNVLVRMRPERWLTVDFAKEQRA
jgi:Pyridoxamine 5'-phosphate oxidase